LSDVNFSWSKEIILMGPSTQWLCLVAGIGILIYGIVKLFGEKDWVLFILGILIIAFTLSKMFKTRGGKGPLPDGKNEV
jgi:hypothetical protein